MDQEKKAQWVAALRSGDYKQGHGLLHTITDGEHQYCCLGVLCDLAEKSGLTLRRGDNLDRGLAQPYTRYVIAYNGNDDFLPQAVMEWAGVTSPNPPTCEPSDVGTPGNSLPATLSWLNDQGKSFSEIADIIERDL